MGTTGGHHPIPGSRSEPHRQPPSVGWLVSAAILGYSMRVNGSRRRSAVSPPREAPGKIDVASPGMAERVRTLTVMCITKASINTAVNTVAATWVATSDPLVAAPRSMTPAACPPTVPALIRRSGDASGDLLSQAVHRRHPGRGCTSLQAAMEYTTSSS